MTQTIQESLSHATASAQASADTHTAQNNPNQQIEYIETIEAYNKWAEVYDTDGNFLQALDTIEMRDVLPRFLARVTDSLQTPSEPPSNMNMNMTMTLVDLGCGTGRNTLELARFAPAQARIIGLDASPGMLEVARGRLGGAGSGRIIVLDTYDILSSSSSPSSSVPGVLQSQAAYGIISTLVLEHTPLDAFFSAAARLIKPGGYLLVTNMHAEMGGISQAGFVDEKTKVKIRPRTSYAHGVEDVLAAAGRVGFEVVPVFRDGVREIRVNEEMVGALGERARKWVGVLVWFGVCFRMVG